MRVKETAPSRRAFSVLDQTDLCDAYEIEIAEPVTARQAAQRIFDRTPKWVDGLMLLRNLLVKPFGLVTSRKQLPPKSDRFGMFPVINEDESCIVLGLDDRHLDFRIVLEVSAAGAHQSRVNLATNVKCHNVVGRVYLAVVKPFHRRIVPALLARLSA